MAEIEQIVPFLIKWEAGTQHKGENLKDLFEKARKKGFVNDKNDRGGATQTGVTLNTYKSWCRKHNISEPTVENLKNIPYETWLSILKENYWDKWKADQIHSQGVANMLVDWLWHSGVHGIKRPQELLGVVPDGIVGNKTLSAVNNRGPITLFHALKDARIKFLTKLASNPSQRKFLKGWLNRVNDIPLE